MTKRYAVDIIEILLLLLLLLILRNIIDDNNNDVCGIDSDVDEDDDEDDDRTFVTTLPISIAFCNNTSIQFMTMKKFYRHKWIYKSNEYII